jgi:hypothetical protein
VKPNKNLSTWLVNIDSWQVFIVLCLIGFATYSIGLRNGFQGDDLSQIVQSVPVHSLRHLGNLYKGGTFYNGNGFKPLSGSYYRPLMTTVFALIYAAGGDHSIYYHVVQLLICILNSFLLYLVFINFFNKSLAMILALVFLVHPIDSEVVYNIACMQDALFFLFGILTFYLILNFRSLRSMIIAVLCLFLSLLSKETGALFILVIVVYLLAFERKSSRIFLTLLILPLAAYLSLKTHAVGVIGKNPNNAPIDRLNLAGRLLTMPSIALFFAIKLILPIKLASGYYWEYKRFSLLHVLLPLVCDIVIIVVIGFLSIFIRRTVSARNFRLFLFFTFWMSIGVVAHLQIVPLDMTVSLSWFYFSMAGLLGMIGVLLIALENKIKPDWFFAVAGLVIVLFAVRSTLWGVDWRTLYVLARNDLSSSSDDYNADNVLANYYIKQDSYLSAKPYAEGSVDSFPTYTSYNSLGLVLAGLKDYPAAESAYHAGLHYGGLNAIYENLAALTLVYGNPVNDRAYLLQASSEFPQDSTIWLCTAIFDDEHNDNPGAKIAITNAARYGQVSATIYGAIMDNQKLDLTLNI